MDRMAVLLPSAGNNSLGVHPDFAEEYSACKSSAFFFPVLYNEYEYACGKANLTVSQPAPTKSQYCIMRGRAVGWETYDNLCHALKRFGYYPALRYESNRFTSFEVQAIDLSSMVFGYEITLKNKGGERTLIPEGWSANEFYEKLATEIQRGPSIPEWSWCLVGDIIESH